MQNERDNAQLTVNLRTQRLRDQATELQQMTEKVKQKDSRLEQQAVEFQRQIDELMQENRKLEQTIAEQDSIKQDVEVYTIIYLS